MNRNLVRALLAVATAGAVAGTTIVAAQGSSERRSDSSTFSARLSGFNEDPAVVSTAGKGWFRAKIHKNGTISYTLAYRNLEGPVTQAHLHLGGRHQSGGISAFLCSNLGTPNVPECPESGSVSGVIEADDVIGPAAQGLMAGEFAELVRAIHAKAVYANVHSELWPGGEIRGQLH